MKVIRKANIYGDFNLSQLIKKIVKTPETKDLNQKCQELGVPVFNPLNLDWNILLSDDEVRYAEMIRISGEDTPNSYAILSKLFKKIKEIYEIISIGNMYCEKEISAYDIGDEELLAEAEELEKKYREMSEGRDLRYDLCCELKRFLEEIKDNPLKKVKTTRSIRSHANKITSDIVSEITNFIEDLKLNDHEKENNSNNEWPPEDYKKLNDLVNYLLEKIDQISILPISQPTCNEKFKTIIEYVFSMLDLFTGFHDKKAFIEFIINMTFRSNDKKVKFYSVYAKGKLSKQEVDILVAVGDETYFIDIQGKKHDRFNNNDPDNNIVDWLDGIIDRDAPVVDNVTKNYLESVGFFIK